ncbi:MAG TPA: squalene/phytoene synthase family protein [Vicinamibacterales bacterium]|nr:squalene/phytoene synthase family protein [Vicinamibacterales bacterium]
MRDTNFYYSFLVLPAEKRRAIIAVWDFCRAVDDATDEIGDRDPASAAEEVQRWRRELAACFEGGQAQTPQGRALVPAIERFHLARGPFDALIEGVEMDLGSRRYETFDDLYQYCIRVASAVGLICLDIFGYREPLSRQYATDLGVALQLTNILRDVAGDLERGRVYIPLEDLRAHGVSEEDLRAAARSANGTMPPQMRALLRSQALRARVYYERAARELQPREATRLVAAEIMAAIYREVLTRIEHRDYDVFSQVVRIPRPRRAVIAAATWARTILRSMTPLGRHSQA